MHNHLFTNFRIITAVSSSQSSREGQGARTRAERINVCAERSLGKLQPTHVRNPPQAVDEVLIASDQSIRALRHHDTSSKISPKRISRRKLTQEPAMSTKQKKGAQRSAIADVVAREYTIHLHKRVCATPHNQKEREELRGLQVWSGGREIESLVGVEAEDEDTNAYCREELVEKQHIIDVDGRNGHRWRGTKRPDLQTETIATMVRAE